MRYFVVFLVLLTTSTAISEARSSSIYVLNHADVSTFYTGFQSALERSSDYQATDWQNPATGLSGSTVPLKTYRTSSGQYCREYLATVQFGSTAQQSFGNACRQAGGSWKITAEKILKRQNQQMKFVFVRQPQQQSCSHAFLHPPTKHHKIGQGYSSPTQRTPRFHSDRFHEKLRYLKRGVQPDAKPRQIEKRQPSKLIRLVGH